MIDEVLKQHQPGDKPRFFLHDEMKAWLSDHLNITIEAGNNRSGDYSLQTKLNMHQGLTVGSWIRINVLIDGEPVAVKGINWYMEDHEKAFQTLATVAENCMIHIQKLQAENQELIRRIELLENPLPV